MKKLTSLTLLIVMAMVFTACGRDGAPKPIPYQNSSQNQQK